MVQNHLVSFQILFFFLLASLIVHAAIQWVKVSAAKNQLVAAYQITSESPLVIKDASKSY